MRIRGGRSTRLAMAGLLVGVLAPPASEAAPSIATPPGYRVTSRRILAPGVDYFTMLKFNPREVVYVVRLDPKSTYKLRPIMSGDLVAESGVRTETTSSMCARARCVAGINGDFFDKGVPLGGQVSDREVFRTPTMLEDQVTMGVDGRMSMGRLTVSVALTTHHGVYVQAGGQRVVWQDLSDDQYSIAGVNGAPARDKLVLYTPRYGQRTLTSKDGVELVVRSTDRGPWRTGAVTNVRAVRLAGLNSAIPRDGAVISASGKAADTLRTYWDDVQHGKADPDLQVRIGTTPGANASMAGYPAMLRGGRKIFPAGAFASAAAPRSIIGWNSRGFVYLVAFDGRQPGWSIGVSLSDAAAFVRGLGVTDAMNFDGGSSTTFVVGGKVANLVSDRIVIRNGKRIFVNFSRPGDVVVGHVQRSVGNALAIVKP